MMKRTNTMGGVMAGIFLIVITAALLIYTSFRTLHFFSQTLPPGQSQAFGYFALAAFDIGLVVWVCLYYFQAYGATQRAISMIMIGVSVLGIVLALFADTLLTSNQNGLTAEKPDPAFFYTTILAMALIISLNIIATIAYHLADPKHKERVGHEQLRAGVRDGVLSQLESQKEEMISRITPIVAAHELRQLEANIIAELSKGGTRILTTPATATKRVLTDPTPKKTRKLAPIRSMAQDINFNIGKTKKQAAQPTPEQVVEKYAPPEPEPEYEYYEEEAEQEQQTDFLSRDGQPIPVRSRGEIVE
jgi:hypothetical protein